MNSGSSGFLVFRALDTIQIVNVILVFLRCSVSITVNLITLAYTGHNPILFDCCIDFESINYELSFVLSA